MTSSPSNSSPASRPAAGWSQAAQRGSHRRRRAGAASLPERWPRAGDRFLDRRRRGAARRCSSQLPANCPPTVITQHMPAAFTQDLRRASRPRSAPRGRRGLRRRAAARPGASIWRPAAPRISRSRAQPCRAAALRDGEPVNGHRPSVDVLFVSMAQAVGADAFGVILTGMGTRRSRRASRDAQGGRDDDRSGPRRSSHGLWHAEGRVRTRSGANARCHWTDRREIFAPPAPRRYDAERSGLMPRGCPSRVLVVRRSAYHAARWCARAFSNLASRRHRELARRRRAGLQSHDGPSRPMLGHLRLQHAQMDGLDFLRALRAHPQTHKTAFILLTGRADKELVSARGAARRQQLPRQALHRADARSRRSKRSSGSLRMTPRSDGPIGRRIKPQAVERRVHIMQGEYAVSDDPNVVLTTVLGSCVAACLRDPE